MYHEDGLNQHRGFNNDSGKIYRQCGLHQYKSNKPIFGELGLDPVQYENKEEVNRTLEQMNSKVKPNFYRGTKKDIHLDKDIVYYEVPKEEIGGDVQQTYGSKKTPLKDDLQTPDEIQKPPPKEILDPLTRQPE